MLRHLCTLFKGSADSDTYYHRRTGIGSCIPHRCQNGILDSFDSICRFQHKHTAHVFTSESLRSHRDLYLLTLYDLIMNDSRCIILRILTVNRILNHGFTEISVYISLAHALIDSISQRTADQMYILSYLDKHNCHSGILADRNHLLTSDT